MKKAKVERKDFQLGLLGYRNTPIEEIGLSTAQMLIGLQELATNYLLHLH